MALKTSSETTPIITVREPLLNTQCQLGEGPIWDPRTQTLHFVDILKNPRLYHYRHDSGKVDVEQFNDPIGCLALLKNGGLACGAATGYGIIEPASSPSQASTIKYMSQPLSADQIRDTRARFNDGACDVKGRFWAGTLQYTGLDGKHRPGQLWRYDPSSRQAVMIDDRDITDSNGIGWTADQMTMYFTNSTLGVIYAYDFDVDSGAATNRRVFVDGKALGLDPEIYGYPDGLCIDREGSIWSARWGGSRVVRFTPDGKKIDLEIHIPKAYNVTACCFGGPKMDKLFITTASCFANESSPLTANEEKQRIFPQSGDLFMVDLSESVHGDLVKEKNLGPGIGDAPWRHEFDTM